VKNHSPRETFRESYFAEFSLPFILDFALDRITPRAAPSKFFDKNSPFGSLIILERGFGVKGIRYHNVAFHAGMINWRPVPAPFAVVTIPCGGKRKLFMGLLQIEWVKNSAKTLNDPLF
jgi:hypothetical protein